MQAGATVTIADNGPGIPEEVQPHLFQPFFTTKGERGTGLGLWVSRGIINKHGGTISLKSDTSAGRTRHGRQRLSGDESNDQRRRRSVQCCTTAIAAASETIAAAFWHAARSTS